MFLKTSLIENPQLLFLLNQKIDAIAECLESSSFENPSLMDGTTGEILFWAYYSSYKKSEEYKGKITTLLSNVFGVVKDGFKYPTFCGGLAGIGWTVEHLVQNSFIKADTDKIICSLDDFLYPYMMQYIRAGNYDYLHGALGIGSYYINRISNPKSAEYLTDLVNELDRQSTSIGSGIAWERQLRPNSDLRGYNLSMSHGTAGIIAVLARLYEMGINQNKASELIYGAVNFLLQNKYDTGYLYQFPAWIEKGQPTEKQGGRLAWCYYDMGIAIGLWQAGQILGIEKWKNEAVEVLLHSTNITDIKESGAHDAEICHGTVGIAHIYHRIYSYTNIPAFKNAAIYWFEQSIKQASFDDGLAGYKTFRTLEYGGWVNDYSFLNGIAGIGLAMISAVSDIDPKWDRALLLS
ncbi:MAG: lanthionine synthetase C family protein [Bacteroidales bacterium]